MESDEGAWPPHACGVAQHAGHASATHGTRIAHSRHSGAARHEGRPQWTTCLVHCLGPLHAHPSRVPPCSEHNESEADDFTDNEYMYCAATMPSSLL